VTGGKVANTDSATTTVTVDGDYMLVANFKIDQFRLVVTATDGGYTDTQTKTGGVTASWADASPPPLDYGTEVTVTAIPYGGWKFIGWSGSIGSSESTFTFILTRDCFLEAVFEPEP
jgi:hypothetical protein